MRNPMINFAMAVLALGACAIVATPASAQNRPLMRSTPNAAMSVEPAAAPAADAEPTSASAEPRKTDVRPSQGLASGALSGSMSVSTSGSMSGSTPGSSQAKGSLGNAATSRGLSSELVTTGVALGATLLVIVLARSAVKRFGGGGAAGKRPSGVVEVLARYPLARGQSIVLIKVARRVIVAHQSSDGMKPLSEFSSEEDVADLLARCEAGARGTSQFSFDALLRQSGKAFDGFGSSAKDRAGKADERIDPRDTLPAVMRGAEIETVDLTRTRKGGAR